MTSSNKKNIQMNLNNANNKKSSNSNYNSKNNETN
jgi:hypothetical protein